MRRDKPTSAEQMWVKINKELNGGLMGNFLSLPKSNRCQRATIGLMRHRKRGYSSKGRKEQGGVVGGMRGGVWEKQRS